MFSSFYTKLNLFNVFFPSSQEYPSKVWLIHCIREATTLQTNGIMLRICPSCLTRVTVEKITSVHMDIR